MRQQQARARHQPAADTGPRKRSGHYSRELAHSAHGSAHAPAHTAQLHTEKSGVGFVAFTLRAVNVVVTFEVIGLPPEYEPATGEKVSTFFMPSRLNICAPN